MAGRRDREEYKKLLAALVAFQLKKRILGKIKNRC